MRVPHNTFVECVEAGRSLDRALSRYSAIYTVWRASLDVDRALGMVNARLSVSRNLSQRVHKARVALHESIEASTRATARDTRWRLAMQRARRTRGRK